MTRFVVKTTVTPQVFDERSVHGAPRGRTAPRRLLHTPTSRRSFKKSRTFVNRRGVILASRIPLVTSDLQSVRESLRVRHVPAPSIPLARLSRLLSFWSRGIIAHHRVSVLFCVSDFNGLTRKQCYYYFYLFIFLKWMLRKEAMGPRLKTFYPVSLVLFISLLPSRISAQGK